MSKEFKYITQSYSLHVKLSATLHNCLGTYLETAVFLKDIWDLLAPSLVYNNMQKWKVAYWLIITR